MKPWLIILLVFVFAAFIYSKTGSVNTDPWTTLELSLIETLRLPVSYQPPEDPSNAVASDRKAINFGKQLFMEPGLSGNGNFSCAHCHQPENYYTDGLKLAKATGKSKRHTPSIIGVASSPWLYWDGRKDSLWSQSLSPLEDPAEQASDRVSILRFIAENPTYKTQYEELFGPLPDFSYLPLKAAPIASSPNLQRAWDDMSEGLQSEVNRAFSNVGKAIAAWERTLNFYPQRFDIYAESLKLGKLDQGKELFSDSETRGLRLFIGKARCIECHNGPLFTNNEFHNTGLLPPPGELPDLGRRSKLALLREDPFNCLGAYSDAASPDDCAELNYMRSGKELIGALRTPSLRNIVYTAPYMHKGQLPTIEAVLEHYNEAEPALIGHNEAEPLGLLKRDLEDLHAFLRTLSSQSELTARSTSP